MRSGMEKRGILITNAFLRTDKFVEHYEWLREAAANHHIRLELMENADCLTLCGEPLSWLDAYDFVLFWDKDMGLGRELSRYAAAKGIPVFNSIDGIAACDDKFETYYRISRWNLEHTNKKIKLLPTMMAPMTYANIGYTTLDFLSQVEKQFSYPVVMKECFGSFGMQVYLAHDRQELEERTLRLAGKPFFYQKYHQYSSGRDVRLQVVGERVVAAMYRYSENGDFRANITNGGRMKIYQPSRKEMELAVQVVRILGLDFAGVDFLFSEKQNDTQGIPGNIERKSECADILCEVNSNAHFKNIADCTGVNVAEHIMRYISEKTV